MKQIKNTPNISGLMEKIYMDEDKIISPIVETKLIGDKMYAIIAEGNKYVIKQAPFVEGKEYNKRDFKYINGVQNREKYLAETIVFAKKKLNFILNESVHSGDRKPLKEGDEKYVIKKDAPNAAPEDDVDLDFDNTDVNIDSDDNDMGDETAQDIETDLDEYQELTGKLSYILRNQDEGQYDDVAKYIFNSLIAALDSDKLDSNVASSMKEKFLAKFEDSSEDQGDEDQVEETVSRIENPYPGEKHRHVNSDSVIDASLMEGQLKKKGYKLVERFSKEGLIAFMGQKDVSGVFNQPTKRYEDGEKKNPHEKEGIHPIGDSQPYDENDDPNEMDKKNVDKPFVEGMQWEDYTPDYIDNTVELNDIRKKRKVGLNTHGIPSASALGYSADLQRPEEEYGDEYQTFPEDNPSLEDMLSDEFMKV